MELDEKGENLKSFPSPTPTILKEINLLADVGTVKNDNLKIDKTINLDLDKHEKNF